MLRKIDRLMNWQSFLPILKRGLKRTGIGPQGYDPLVLFKCLLIGQWHGLSDPKLERALKVRLDFMIFCGLDLHAPVPDETTHCRFRNALVRGGVYDDLLSEVCRQIEACGLKLKEAEAAIIDATLIESSSLPAYRISRPRRTAPRAMSRTIQSCISVPIQTRGGSRRVQRALWVTRALPAPTKRALSPRFTSTPANKGESPAFATMIDGAKARRVLADKTCASKANRDMLRSRHRDGIMRKAVRGRPLRASEKRFNKLISKRRFRVEQCFGTMKRLFGLHRARYFGLAKTHAHLAMAAIKTARPRTKSKSTASPSNP